MNERAQTFAVVGVVVLMVFGGLALALTHGRSGHSAGGGAGGPNVAGRPAPINGIPMKWKESIGQVNPAPVDLRSEFPVVSKFEPADPADPTSVPGFEGDLSVDVYPGMTKTLKTGLGNVGGVVDVGGFAYVLTDTRVVAIDIHTWKVSTLAGSEHESGCAVSHDPKAVRFTGPSGDAVSDGRDVFVATGCGIEKVSIATGATSLLEKWTGAITPGPDGNLYAASPAGGRATIVAIDPRTGASKPFLRYPPGSEVTGLAADSSDLWVAYRGPTAHTVLDEVDFAKRTVQRFAYQGVDMAGQGQLLSAGNYLYAPTPGNHGVIRFTKDSGDWGVAVGPKDGEKDGDWHWAEFGDVWGISLGGQLWVTDSGNGSLRRVEFSQSDGLGL